MAESVPVRVGDTEFWVEIADGEAGPQVVSGVGAAFSFDTVRGTIEAIAGQLAQAWDKTKPHEATVELGLALTTKTGKLSALLVEGGGSATINVKLTWKRD
ncbi:CU044_2847 family protein [Nocardia sp. NPDC048505]|uniref:CU044_2847 family protein n=1 Tax=unclassified Nocardia TaxID=2637762 RepID=UPI0033DC528B